MSLIASARNDSFIPAPQGVHQGVCVDVVDLGIVDKGWGPKPTCRIVFQLDVLMESGKRFIVSRDFNVTLNEKGNLLPFLVNWRGQTFSQEELEGFPLENLVGANGNVQVLHNKGSNGNTYANITAVLPLMHGQPKLVNEGYVRVKDREQQPVRTANVQTNHPPPTQPQRQQPAQPAQWPPTAPNVDEIPF